MKQMTKFHVCHLKKISITYFFSIFYKIYKNDLKFYISVINFYYFLLLITYQQINLFFFQILKLIFYTLIFFCFCNFSLHM